MSNNLFKIKTREQIQKLEATIRWREQTDRLDGIEVLEQKLEELKKGLESFEV